MRPRSHHKVSVFKLVDETPSRFTGTLFPINLAEEKERFLKHGIVPKFVIKGSSEAALKAASRERGQIRLSLLQEAKHILDVVKDKYGDGSDFVAANFGPPLDQDEATLSIAEYLEDNGLEGQMTIYWTPDLTCSARMMWHGPNLRYNKPERRKYTLIIKNTQDNNFLRESGITCLMDHEIGTHYFRMVNEGLQPWFSDRKKFGLRPSNAREAGSSEEGLATVNTLLNAKTKYLWSSALLYYTSCKAAHMSFRELYEHMERYVRSPDLRWRHVMRVKRGLKDPNEPGGYGNDQCYFEGAVDVLRNLETIDFHVLYAGRVCVDEVQRVRRLARLDCIKLPTFLQDIERYKRTLRQIGYLNGIIPRPEKIPSTPSRKRTNERRKLNSDGAFYTPTPPPLKDRLVNRSVSQNGRSRGQNKEDLGSSICLVEEVSTDDTEGMPERLLMRPRRKRVIVKKKNSRLKIRH